MSFRCFKSKSAIYGTIRNDNKHKSKSPLALDESILKSPKSNQDGTAVNDDSYQLHRSVSDLSLFRLMDNGISSDFSHQFWSNNIRVEGASNCSMEQLIDNWSKSSNYSTNVSDSQKFISNLMSKKAFDAVKEPLRSLPREMSVKCVKEPSYLITSSDAIIKDRSLANNNYKKQHISTKHLPPDKPLSDTLGTFSSGPLAIVRGIENRNSGGSSSVATPNSPQQSPLSLCSSSGGKSSDEQFYEDGLSAEELQQISVRQQQQIYLQREEIHQKQQQIYKLKQQIEKTAKHLKISPTIMKFKEIYNQQEIKLKAIRNSKNQANQSKNNYNSLKSDINNFQSIINSKKKELKKIEMHTEELKEYFIFLQQRGNSSTSVPPNFEAFIRQKNSSIQTVQPTSEPPSHNYQVRCTDSQINYHHKMQSVTTYPDPNRLYVRQMPLQNEDYSSNNFVYCNTSDISAFIPPNSNYRTKVSDSTGRAPPLPAHSYQRSPNQMVEKSQLQVLTDMNQSNQLQKTKRPPLPSYSDATMISATHKYSMFLLQASRRNPRTPTSSPPVVRRTSIVGLPYGKMPSRFASRNTINNVYIKKSSLETVEKYKKTASDIYKAQLSKFKSSSTDDVRIDDPPISDLQDQAKQKDENSNSEPQTTLVDPTHIYSNQDSNQPENISVCSSCSSLSLPEDLVDIQPSTDQSGQVEETAFIQPIDDVNSSSENDIKFQDVSDFDGPIWNNSVLRALDALKKEPTKRILKKVPCHNSPNSNKRKAHFHPHSLLLDAALEAEFDLVKEMSTKVDNISEATDEGITALHNAVCSGREDIVKFLLDLGAHVNAGDTDGWTPLHCAASCNNVGMARLLVEYGASLFATSISDSEIPLQKCEVDDDVECEQYLFNQQDLLGVVNESKVYALFHYEPKHEDEFSIYPNQELKIIDKEPQGEPGWFLAAELNDSKKQGLVPKAYVSCYRLVLPNKTNIALSE